MQMQQLVELRLQSGAESTASSIEGTISGRLAINLTLSFDWPLVWETVKCVSSQIVAPSAVWVGRASLAADTARGSRPVKPAKQKHNRTWSEKDEGILRKMLAETAKASTRQRLN
jgi:hypothetical protein